MSLTESKPHTRRTRKKTQTSIGDDFIGTRFGPNNCLEVVAWCGETAGYNKKYTVFCSVCCEDPELFGLGLFLITKHKVKIGRVPCGCSRSVYSWSEDQYIVKIHREINRREFKYEFLGFSEPFRGKDTKMHLSCELGETKTVSVSNFLRGQKCKLHANQSISNKNRKSQENSVEAFMSTEAYCEGTIFSRSEKRNKNGWLVYWDVYCPLCEESYQSLGSNLSSGRRGCSCSQRNHNRAYLHLLELNSEVVGLKYGITSMENKRRLNDQNKKSTYDISEIGVWYFDEVSACRRAEGLCKAVYNRYVTKELLPDGYTETAPFTALHHIISIYEENGGVLVNEQD